MTDIEQARECVAKAFEASGETGIAGCFRAGRMDASHNIAAVLAAIEGERERAAGVAQGMASENGRDADGYHAACDDIAAAIRALKP